MRTSLKSVLSAVVVICLALTGCVSVKSTLNYQKGKMAMNSENYLQAISLYSQYLVENPNSCSARNDLALAYMETGQDDKAMQELNLVLKDEPDNPGAVLNLGLLYLKNTEMEKAIKVWQTYKNPKQPLIEEAIKQQLTLMIISQNQKYAQKAVANEKKLGGGDLDPNIIAVSSYNDLSPDNELAAFQRGLAVIVITDLSKVPGFTVVERMRLNALINEMKLGQSGIVKPSTAARVGNLVGAGSVTIGSLTQGIQTTTSLLDTSEGKVAGSDVCIQSPEQFFKLSSCIVRDITLLRGMKLDKKQLDAVTKPHTTNYDSFIYFGRGIEAFDASRWGEAKNLFAMALKEDPKFDLAQYYYDSCPDSNDPTAAQLKSMEPKAFALNVTKTVEHARATQHSVDMTATSRTIKTEEGGGGGGGGCFTYDTKVFMAGNIYKRIIDLRVGDKVIARDMSTGELVEREVLNFYQFDQDHYFLINGALKMTATHPILTSSGEWKTVVELKTDDVVTGMSGPITVSSIERIPYDHKVYNFSVKDSHNYFVTAYGNGPYLVHNCK